MAANTAPRIYDPAPYIDEAVPTPTFEPLHLGFEFRQTGAYASTQNTAPFHAGTRPGDTGHKAWPAITEFGAHGAHLWWAADITIGTGIVTPGAQGYTTYTDTLIFRETTTSGVYDSTGTGRKWTDTVTYRIYSQTGVDAGTVRHRPVGIGGFRDDYIWVAYTWSYPIPGDTFLYSAQNFARIRVVDRVTKNVVGQIDLTLPASESGLPTHFCANNNTLYALYSPHDTAAARLYAVELTGWLDTPTTNGTASFATVATDLSGTVGLVGFLGPMRAAVTDTRIYLLFRDRIQVWSQRAEPVDETYMMPSGISPICLSVHRSTIYMGAGTKFFRLLIARLPIRGWSIRRSIDDESTWEYWDGTEWGDTTTKLAVENLGDDGLTVDSYSGYRIVLAARWHDTGAVHHFAVRSAGVGRLSQWSTPVKIVPYLRFSSPTGQYAPSANLPVDTTQASVLPRPNLVAESVIARPAVKVEFGVDAVTGGGDGWILGERDNYGRLLDYPTDLTEYVILPDSTLERDSCNIHGGTARLSMIFGDRPAPYWPALRIRPRMRISDATDPRTNTGWHNLGVYFAETPRFVAGPSPTLWDIDFHDTIIGLSHPYPDGFALQTNLMVGAGIEYAIAAAPRIDTQPWIIDPKLSDIATVLPSPREWPLAATSTPLLVLDQLLEGAGWRPPWTDRHGVLTSAPLNAADSISLVVDTTAATPIVGDSPTTKLETWGLPNRWTYVADVADPELPDPTEANGGIIKFVNRTGQIEVEAGSFVGRVVAGPSESTDRTSIRSRGREIVDVQYRDVYSPDALFELAAREIATAAQPYRTYCAQILINPLLWQRDTISVTDHEAGIIDQYYRVASWSMPLGGAATMSIVADGL